MPIYLNDYKESQPPKELWSGENLYDVLYEEGGDGYYYLSDVPQKDVAKDPLLYLHGTPCYKIELIDRYFIITQLKYGAMNCWVFRSYDAQNAFEWLLELGVFELYWHTPCDEGNKVMERREYTHLPNINRAIHEESMYR